jgi:NAD(P)H-flavin reductase/ferredoxin
MSLISVEPFFHSYDHMVGETVLEAALRNNKFLKYGCRHGGCGSCKIRLIAGDVEEIGSSFALTSEDRSNDLILACASIPLGPCTIDVTPTNLTQDEYFAGDNAHTYEASLAYVEDLTADITRVRLDLSEPICFLAGQFVNVEVPPENVQRSFSIASAPDTPYVVELIVKRYATGAFGRFLSTAKLGTTVRFTGPYGALRIHASHRPILMVAGGSGLAPILSILRDLVARCEERPVSLFFGARTEEDLYLVEEISLLGDKLAGFEFVPVLSESWSRYWTGEIGLVTDALARAYPKFAHDAYVCGPPPMVSAVSDLLTARGVRKRNIYFDAFTPAHPQ